MLHSNSLPGLEDSVLLAFWPTPGDFLDDITGKTQQQTNVFIPVYVDKRESMWNIQERSVHINHIRSSDFFRHLFSIYFLHASKTLQNILMFYSRFLYCN